MRVTVKQLSKNKNAHKRKDRTPVRFSQFKEMDYIGDGILYFSFWIDESKTDFCVFLRENTNCSWSVSECDNYVLGDGVVSKIHRIGF